MQTTIHQHSLEGISARSYQHNSPWSRFIKWAEGQEKNRFGWVAGILLGHGCFVTIITMVAIVFTGNHFIFWPFAIAGMAACVISNLAAMPTKITLPIFFFSLVIDLAIILICLVNGFNVSATYV